MIIRKALKEDAEGKGYVHYQAWLETYTGLIDPDFLSTRSLARCITIAREHPENTFVAEKSGKIVGFASYCKARDTDMEETGEIQALYVLKAYQKQGVGKALMERCETELNEYSQIMLYVLSENKTAIGFYEHNGYQADGITKHQDVMHGVTLFEIRMIKNRLNAGKDN